MSSLDSLLFVNRHWQLPADPNGLNKMKKTYNLNQQTIGELVMSRQHPLIAV